MPALLKAESEQAAKIAWGGDKWKGYQSESARPECKAALVL